MREEAPELWDQELRGLLKETSPLQFHFPASWDMGWAEGLTGGGGQRDPGKALSRLRTSLRDVGGKRASGEVSEEEVGAILVGMAPKSGYYWNCCLVSWLITLLPFTVTQQRAARLREMTGVCGLSFGEIGSGRCWRGQLFQGQHGNMRCPKGPVSLASTLAWQRPLHCPAPPVAAARSWVWFFPTRP